MQKYISIQNIFIFAIFVLLVNGCWQKNRKNYYKAEMFNNFHQRDSLAAVARLQNYELLYLEDYVNQTDYYRELADSLWNEMLNLESTFKVQHKIIIRNRKSLHNVYDKYKEAKTQTDTITITETLYKDKIYKKKESIEPEKKEGFFKRLFKKKDKN